MQQLAQRIPQNSLASMATSLTHSLLPFPLKVPLNFDDYDIICIHVASPVSWTWTEWKAYDFIWKEFWARRNWTKVLIATLVRELLPHSGLFPNVYFRDLVGESSIWSNYSQITWDCAYIGISLDFLKTFWIRVWWCGLKKPPQETSLPGNSCVYQSKNNKYRTK